MLMSLDGATGVQEPTPVALLFSTGEIGKAVCEGTTRVRRNRPVLGGRLLRDIDFTPGLSKSDNARKKARMRTVCMSGHERLNRRYGLISYDRYGPGSACRCNRCQKIASRARLRQHQAFVHPETGWTNASYVRLV